MEDSTPDETPSRAPSRRSRTRSGDLVPVRLDLGGESAVSSITNTSAATRRAAREATRQRDQLTLVQLANVSSPLGPWTDVPAIPFDPVAFEEDYDNRARQENAGADDSESDGEADDENPVGPDLADRQMQEDDNEAVVGAEAEFGLNPLIPEPVLFGAPVGWLLPAHPDDWKPDNPKENKGEPSAFDKIDNPGGWTPFTFRPKFKRSKEGKVGEYLYHAMPTGVTPIPADTNGKRTCQGWEFHYKGWELPPPLRQPDDGDFSHVFRNGATRENMFPASRKGSVDMNILRKLGLARERMIQADGAPDSLFFHQLLLPIHAIDKDKNQMPVPDDPRMPFYAPVSKWSNAYAVGELELGCGYGHKFVNVTPAECVLWDGVVVMDGVRGGSKGAMMRRFDKREDNTAYDKYCDAAMTKTRWLEMKRVVKLCNNQRAPKRGQEGYDPAYKYDYLFKTVVHNVNAITKEADLDLCVDETTCAHQGYGEKDAGLCVGVKGKPHVTKGMQTVIATDVHRIRPRAYVHRHKKHRVLSTKEGPNEIRLLWEDKLLPLVEPLHPLNPLRGRAIFSQKPHITCDNFFSGDDTLTYAAAQGFGVTMTTRRDRLPGKIPSKYFHKEKTQTQTKRTKAARFMWPVFAEKEYSGSRLQITSFQSTSSCNISHVNALNRLSLYSTTKEKGRGHHKRRWGIEMNESRELYLKTYGAVDRLDHLIHNCEMYYRSWKYWHSAMLHGKAMAVVVAYDIYLEVAAGILDRNLAVRPVDFHRFREKLAIQMLTYCPKNRMYPGDEKFRVYTQIPRAKRPRMDAPSVASDYSTRSGVDRNMLSDSRQRLCGFLDDLLQHERDMKALPRHTHRVCVACGKACYHYCSLCPGSPPLHLFKPNGRQNTCFLHYHNTASFGAWKNDQVITGRKKKEWRYPDDSDLQQHSQDMTRLHLHAAASAPAAPMAPPAAAAAAPVAAAASASVASAPTVVYDPPINPDNCI